ncbi:DUF6527 family protein [Mucilaginibacter segetis]|uniref:Uncharacterized protein n=1 Tax=Mucilaginibacter segetis TaxID=2793071 RepID=A0A934PUY1_9SPHI|nr:DUF6527 family protein [Mucilaginibacter segetis]MBK0380026.1 hypothetical protein [Mucilaginibacter segetis]
MKKLRHEFVQYMPEQQEEGVIYISMKYRLAVHKCVCGCGNKVITPFSPTDWELRFYGDSISLSPSIGNWNFDCQSHYWIVKNQIRFAGRWSEQQINDGRKRDKKRKGNFYADDTAIKPVEVIVTQPVVKSGWKLKRLKSFFSFLS